MRLRVPTRFGPVSTGMRPLDPRCGPILRPCESAWGFARHISRSSSRRHSTIALTRMGASRQISGPGEPADYLHECAGLHSTLLERLSGRVERLESVERAVAGVRSSRKLTQE